MVFRLHALLLLLSFSLFAEEIIGRVVRVADGDTLTVLATTGTTGILPVGNTGTGTTGVPPVGNAPTGTTGVSPVGNVPVQHKVRLQGIDAPEKKQPFGRAARRGLWQDKNPTEPEQFRKAKRTKK